MSYVFSWALKNRIYQQNHTRDAVLKTLLKKQWQKESNRQRFERNENHLILFFVLLFRRGIEIDFQRLRIFATPKKVLFDVISLLGDLVIAYRINLVVIMPRAFNLGSTFHDQCPVHIRVLTMFTGTFRVKGGGRFRVTTFSFLTVFFSVVVALLGGFSFTAILRSHFLFFFLLPLFL